VLGAGGGVGVGLFPVIEGDIPVVVAGKGMVEGRELERGRGRGGEGGGETWEPSFVRSLKKENVSEENEKGTKGQEENQNKKRANDKRDSPSLDAAGGFQVVACVCWGGGGGGGRGRGGRGGRVKKCIFIF
jgi:hypothetical protein